MIQTRHPSRSLGARLGLAALVVAAGSIVGLLVATLELADEPTRSTPAESTSLPRDLDTRRRHHRAEAKVLRPVAPHSANQSHVESPPAAPTEADLLAEDRDYDDYRAEVFSSRLGGVRAQPRDATWARATRLSLSADIEENLQAAGLKSVVLAVECFRTACVAELSFDDYEQALASIGTLRRGQYERNCGHEVLFERPEDTTVSYQGSMIFHCRQ